ncbi:MAG TPA: DUF2863 family protein [Burkholderiaceae bacterium]|nr:DUF2863 family protein [Burkholderiaceae bacterium]
MRRSRYISRARHHADAETLAKLARRMAESGSRLEDQLWERRLVELINDRLARGFEEAIDAALDELSGSNPRAYDDLADLAESCAESSTIEIDGRAHDGLLLALPILAWSRYKLPTLALNSAMVDNVAVQIAAHLAARGARCAIADMLYSIDQLPESFGEVRDVAEALFGSAAQDGRLKIDPKSLREPIAMLADSRYLLAAIVVPQGAPVYHWQQTGVDPDAKAAAVEAFREQLTNILTPIMTGCRFRVLAPNAFHAALRLGDRELREFSLEAAISFLKLSYELSPSSLQATMAVYEEKRNQPTTEIRIGVSRIADDDVVIEGVVWPLLGDDEERTLEEIEAAIKRLGINRIVAHTHRFPLEYCDDCGAPVFPNPSGHSVHTEPPEDGTEQPASPLH